MKKVPEYLQTSLWQPLRIDNPYEYLDEFFVENYLRDYRELIMQFCEAAFSSGKYWDKAAPGNLIFYLGKFESLINAAFILRKSQKLGIVFEFKTKAHRYEIEVPILLTNKEVKYPMLVVKEFFKENNLKEWKKILGLIMEHSLEIGSMVNENEMYNGIRIYRFLVRLTEATFLIYHYKVKGSSIHTICDRRS